MGESFTDTFSYYPRVLGLNLIFIILIIAINLLLGKLISITTSYGFLMFHFILYFFYNNFVLDIYSNNTKLSSVL